MILFKPFHFPDTNEVNTYMIGCGKTRNVFLIDAGADTPEYEEFLQENGAKLKGIFLTHFHWDHDQCIDPVLDRHDVPVYSMTGNTKNGKKVSEGDLLPLGELRAKVYQTTGHTPDGITLVIDDKIAFVGDALFAGSVGGTSSPEKHEEEKTHIRQKIFSLPDDTLICSGHGPMTTVYLEKNYNPFFKF